MKKFLYLILWLFSISEGQTQAKWSLFKQPNNFKPYGAIGLGVGSANYYGEMSPSKETPASFFKLMRWNVSASYTRQFSPRFAAKASFSVIRLEGDDYNFRDDPNRVALFLRNLHFRNTLKELAFTGQFHFLPVGKNFRYRSQWSPYAFAGIAVLAHNPQARAPVGTEDNKWVDLQPLRTEGQGLAGYGKPYSLVQLAVPVGAGVRYQINKRLDFSFEFGFRYTFTDYLDDVGGKLADPNDLENQVSGLSRLMANRSLEQFAARTGQDRTEQFRQYLITYFGFPNDPNLNPFATPLPGFSAKGDQRGNSGRLDSYLVTGFQLHYIIVRQAVRCPPIR